MFRARALRRISSPEQLDQLVRVTVARRWIGLAALLLIVAALIVWSVVSVVPTTVAGPGYLLPLGGLREIQAPASGTVSAVYVARGSHVVAGQTIGAIAGPGRSSTAIPAPETGTITEGNVLPGSVVRRGQRLGFVEPVGWPLVLYSYVPTSIAAGLAPGTPVHVSFGAGIGAAYGYAKGRVTVVSKFATTPERLNFILKDSAVVSQVRALGPTNEVSISLDMSAKSASGLSWGSGAGPPASLPAGLPADVTFIVGSRHPIDDVL